MKLKERQICIIGTGGLGREALTCLADAIATTSYKIEQIAVFMVSDSHYKEQLVMGIPVIKQSDFIAKKYEVVVAIGDPKIKKKVVEELPINTKYTSIIHPSAIISKWVEVGEGSIILAYCSLTCNIKVGKHASLNPHTTIAHDCRIGDYFTASPAANISGNCTIGECVYFGTNASVRQGITICSNVTIGMGAVVIKNIDKEGVYIGNPTRELVKKSTRNKQ